MKYGRWFLALLAGVALVPVSIGAPSVSGPSISAPSISAALADVGPPPDEGGQPDGGQPTGLCRPGTPPNAPPTTAFFNGNPLFGPAQLPTASPVGPLLSGYQRFGALGPAEFLAQYGNTAGDAYVYPPALGFVIAPDGRPIKAAQQLLPGYRLDRFGFPGGAFLAPLGTPFSSRSLPPSNLNTPANAPLANYHVYCVVKPFTVDSGPIAPWFAQPGMGTQFKLEQKYLPEAGAALSITWLLAHGYLVEEDITAGNCRADAAGAAAANC